MQSKNDYVSCDSNPLLINSKLAGVVDSDSGWSPDDTQACAHSEPLIFPEDDEWCQNFPANTNEDLEELLKLIDSSTLFCDSNFLEGDQLSFYETTESEGARTAIKKGKFFSQNIFCIKTVTFFFGGVQGRSLFIILFVFLCFFFCWSRLS